METDPRYEVIIYWSTEDEAFIAEVPELPGCAADGPTYEKALANVQGIIAEWIETAQELGRAVPEPGGRPISTSAAPSARAVQVSIDTDLLRRIDADPEARERGRSAFIRSAVELYLTARERREIDSRLARAYQGEADVLLAEIEELLGEQSWPSD